MGRRIDLNAICAKSIVMKHLLVLAVCWPLHAAATCPPNRDNAAQMASILAQFQEAKTAQDAVPLTQALWNEWLIAPDAVAQDLLDRGMRLRESGAFVAARQVFNDLVAYCPNYAEGYNQRAFASFLHRDLEAALIDLNRAIAILPTHIAALSGKGLTLVGLGRQDEADAALQAALDLNPWLAERRFLSGPEGTDI